MLKREGFVLFEVLISMVLLVFAVTTLLQDQTNALLQTVQAWQVEEAVQQLSDSSVQTIKACMGGDVCVSQNVLG